MRPWLSTVPGQDTPLPPCQKQTLYGRERPICDRHDPQERTFADFAN